MQRDEILTKLRLLKPKFGAMNIKRLALFGSAARDEAHAGSDVDLLIEFAGRPKGLIALSQKQREIADYLGCPVDLYPLSGVSPERHPYIVRDMIDV